MVSGLLLIPQANTRGTPYRFSRSKPWQPCTAGRAMDSHKAQEDSHATGGCMHPYDKM